MARYGVNCVPHILSHVHVLVTKIPFFMESRREFRLHCLIFHGLNIKSPQNPCHSGLHLHVRHVLPHAHPRQSVELFFLNCSQSLYQAGLKLRQSGSQTFSMRPKAYKLYRNFILDKYSRSVLRVTIHILGALYM